MDLVGYGISYLTVAAQRGVVFGTRFACVSGEIARIVVRGYDPIICAHNGVAGVAQPFAFIGGRPASIAFMLLVLTLTFLVYGYSERLIRSPYGRLLKAIREDERTAKSLGKDAAKIRAQVMAIGSVIAAISGVLFALNIGFVNTNDYVVTLTLDVWVMIVLGGIGNNRGALLGALIITILDRVTAIVALQMNMLGSQLEFNYLRFILFGVILLLMLRFSPGGILPESPQTTNAHEYYPPANVSADRS